MQSNQNYQPTEQIKYNDYTHTHTHTQPFYGSVFNILHSSG